MPRNPFDAVLYLVAKAILSIATVAVAAILLILLIFGPAAKCDPGFVRTRDVCVIGYVPRHADMEVDHRIQLMLGE